jgi:hypothetical protein
LLSEKEIGEKTDGRGGLATRRSGERERESREAVVAGTCFGFAAAARGREEETAAPARQRKRFRGLI